MLNINPKFLPTPHGEDLVLLTRAEFDALIALAAEAEENADDVALYDQRMAELKVEPNSLLPVEVSRSMLKGDSLLKALREWKGFTQMHLAFKTGLTQGYVSDLESGRRKGTQATLMLVADALGIDRAWLVEDRSGASVSR